MICRVTTNAWLSRSDQLTPGAELYRSDRMFALYDYTSSHRELLLRSLGNTEQTRIDVLFKPVDVMKVRTFFPNGLCIRCATPAEQARIQAENPEITYRDPAGNQYDQGHRFFVVEPADGGFGYIVAQAVGWHEDHDLGEPSYFADPSGGAALWSRPPTPRWAQTALYGVNGGLGSPMATMEELVDTVATSGQTPDEDRARYRYIYVITGKFEVDTAELVRAVGAFLTRTEAEQHRQQLVDRHAQRSSPNSTVHATFTVDAVPVAI